ncbi:MAG TPA: response regulator transcription factor [Chitinophagaceae bacterium]|nr:response regulator transcription factor [Chitinophagaceae bacterium]
MTQYSIAIVDDHQIVSEAIAGLINGMPQFKVLYEVRNGRELVNKFSNKKNVPDLVLLDINMPIMNGFETAAWLQEEHPELPFVALTMNDDDESIIKMLRLGAKGYLIKDIDSDELLVALDEVIKKGFYYTDLVTSKLLLNLGDKRSSVKSIEMKEKELEFIRLVCTEMTYKEIAEAMYVSPKTIDGYRDALFQKLDVKNRIGLVMFAIKQGWVEV